MNEIWKDIKGYEGLYQVSNLGRVKSFYDRRRKIEHYMNQRLSNRGYLCVILSKKHKTKIFYVHRLVATAFIINENDYKIINHKDEDKTNNCVDNLEWCTQKYNSNYGTSQKRRSDSRKIPIVGIFPNGEHKQFKSAIDASYELGIKPTNIYQCLHKEKHRKHTKGISWYYCENESEVMPIYE